jgi:hypothetical protein
MLSRIGSQTVLRPQRRALSVIPAPKGSAKLIYRQLFRSTGLYWTTIVASMAVAGYVFDEVTLGYWQMHNRGKLFKDMIGTFPEKMPSDDDEEEEEAPSAVAEETPAAEEAPAAEAPAAEEAPAEGSPKH